MSLRTEVLWKEYAAHAARETVVGGMTKQRAKIRFLHDRRADFEDAERAAIAIEFLVEVGDAEGAWEVDASCRRQARVVLAAHLISIEHPAAYANAGTLVRFYGKTTAHNRKMPTPHEKAVQRFLRWCWVTHRRASVGDNVEVVIAPRVQIVAALVHARAFDALVEEWVTDAIPALYAAIRAWVGNVPCNDGSVPEHPEMLHGDASDEKTIALLVDHAVNLSNPGEGMDRDSIFAAAKALDVLSGEYSEVRLTR